MTIKSRIAKLECTKAAEPLIVLFNTIYQTEDGSDDDETGRAVIIWGPGQTETIDRRAGESSSDWRKRLDQLAAAGPAKTSNKGGKNVAL